MSMERGTQWCKVIQDSDREGKEMSAGFGAHSKLIQYVELCRFVFVRTRP